MKYLKLFEFPPENLDKIIPLKEEPPEKFPKDLSEEYSFYGQCKGFQIIEATKEQLMNHQMLFFGLAKIKYIPIIEAPDLVEVYLKMKQ